MHTLLPLFWLLAWGTDAGGELFQNRFGDNLVALYNFTDGQTTPGTTTVTDSSNSTFSPGNLQFGVAASWVPNSIGVRLTAQPPGTTPGVGLTSTSTLSTWILNMRTRQATPATATPTFTVEMWLRSRNTPQIFARALVGFRNWSGAFDNPGIQLQSFGMKVADNLYVDMYATQANSSGWGDLDGSFNTTLGNSESLLMVTASYCARVNTNNFGDCYVNDDYINSSTMAFCLTIRGGMNYTSCKSAVERISNVIDYRAWSVSNLLQFAPIYSSSAQYQPNSWAGDILLTAVYSEALDRFAQEQNYAAGLPNSNPTVPLTGNMTAYEDTMNASTIYALLGYDYDGDELGYDILQLPQVGTLYWYDTGEFLPINSVPLRIRVAKNVSVQLGYLQAPALTYGNNFATFTFRAWDGRGYSRTNGTVTINVIWVNHAPYAFASSQVVTLQAPTAINAFNCSDPDVAAGDSVSQYCIASAPRLNGTFLNSPNSSSSSRIASFPYCFQANATASSLWYKSVAVADATGLTDAFTFYCTDKSGALSNVADYVLFVQNGVFALPGNSSGPENDILTVQFAGTSNITTSSVKYQIVSLPSDGALYNGDFSVISFVPTQVIDANGSASNKVYFAPPLHTTGLYARSSTRATCCSGYSMLFTASITTGNATTTSQPALQQLIFTPINYNFTVSFPATAVGYTGVPIPITAAVTSFVTPTALFYVKINVDVSALEQVTLNFAGGLNVSRFDSSGALGTYTCLNDFRGCAFWATQDAVNSLLDGVTVSRFTLGSDIILFTIVSCLSTYCTSSNYSQSFNVTYTWGEPPPTASAVGLDAIYLYLIYAGLALCCCCCCIYPIYRRQCTPAAAAAHPATD